MGQTIAKRKPKAAKPTTRTRTRKAKALTIREMAEGIGVSTVTIDKYVKRGCPRTSVEAVQKWRAENIKAVAEDAEVSDLGVEAKRAEIAERWENARTRQIKNDLASGRLLSRAEVELDLRTAMSRIVNRLASLGMACANLCPAELKVPIKERVEETVRIALKELSDDMKGRL